MPNIRAFIFIIFLSSWYEKNINWTHYRNHFPWGFIRVPTRKEAELDKFDTRSAHARSFVLSNWEKKLSFPSGGTNPLYFSRNSSKGHIKERKTDEGRKAAFLVFFLSCRQPSNLRSQSSPSIFVFPVRLSHYFIFFSTLFPHTPDPSSSPLLVLSLYLLQPLVFRWYPLTNFPLLFQFVLLAYHSFMFPYLVYFFRVFLFFRFCFSFDHCLRACVIVDVRN